MKNPAFYKGFFGSVRSNRTAYRFRSLHLLVISFSALVSEGSKQSVHSFSFTSLRFIRSHTVCIELASSHGGLCSSSQASNESTGRRKRYGTASRTLRFLHLPVSASGPLLYGLWQRKPPNAVSRWICIDKEISAVRVGRNLKLRARKKCSPFPP